MAVAPRQNWSLYEGLTRAENNQWLRELSPQDRVALYEDMFNLIWNARSLRRNSERLDEWLWEQKLALRMQQVEAFMKLDQRRRERAAANRAC